MVSISVIIPVYNVEAWLPRCIDSLLSQTYKDYELILVDDGSTDKSGIICDEYASAHHNISVLHKQNAGVSAARNSGIEKASGEYIAFVDSDDHVAGDYLEKLMSYDSDLVICGLVGTDPEGKRLYDVSFAAGQYSCRGEIDYAYMYRKLMLYSCYCKRFKRSIVVDNSLRFPQELTWGEDGVFVCDYLAFVETVSISPYTGYYYVKYQSSGTLATKLRSDIVDDIVCSRTYLFEKMKLISPTSYEAVRAACEEDILSNCAYFVERAITAKVGFGNRVCALKEFLKNDYVQKLKTTPVENRSLLRHCLKCKSAWGTILTYRMRAGIKKPLRAAKRCFKKIRHNT